MRIQQEEESKQENEKGSKQEVDQFILDKDNVTKNKITSQSPQKVLKKRISHSSPTILSQRQTVARQSLKQIPIFPMFINYYILYILQQDAKSKLLFRAHQFAERQSILDYSNTKFEGSDLWGLLNYLNVLALLYIITTCSHTYQEQGMFFDSRFIDLISVEFELCLSTWPLFYIWSHGAFILQKQLLKGMNVKIFWVFHLFISFAPLFYSAIIAHQRMWCISHGFFVSSQACIFMMKIYSYGVTNLGFHQQQSYQDILIRKNPLDSILLYPANINAKNFTSYLWHPVLVYEMNYPTKQNIRICYILQKLGFCVFYFVLMNQLIIFQLYPAMDRYNNISLYLLIDMLIPVALGFLILFLLIFEMILNCYAEISGLSDRYFYGPWWSTTGFSDFNRYWNVPVHLFLHRHIYVPLRNKGRITAYVDNHFIQHNIQYYKIATYIVTAALHEYCIYVAYHRLTPIFFVLCLTQIPMTLYGQVNLPKTIKNHVHFFNIIFGNSLMIYLYLKVNEYY